MIESEVIIIGGGPAGSTCAWKLKQHNIKTIILDKKTFPRLKLCAGWITPKVIKDLQFKIEEYPHSFLIFNKLYFHFYGRKFPIKTRQYSIRRYEFDHWLVQRAGVPLYHHTANQIHKANDRYIIDDKFRCKYLVGAGGTNCPVYRTFFKEINPRVRDSLITTMEEEFVYNYHDKNCYLWFFDNNFPGYSWYVPKANGYLNVGIGGKFSVLKDKKTTIKEHWNLFVRKLNKYGLVVNYSFQPRGCNYYLHQKMKVSQLDNLFIIGDSAGLATIDMGEGIGSAIKSGILAAKAIINKNIYCPDLVTKYSFINILFPWWTK
jgi:flavin-dependent dehydrogenase